MKRVRYTAEFKAEAVKQAPEHDHGALELDVSKAVELGQARAKVSASVRMLAAAPHKSKKD